MKRFDWRPLQHLKIEDIIEYFYCLNYNIVTNKIYKKVERQAIKKDSYILNIKDLLENKVNATKDEVFIYLFLLSRRNYLDYKFYKLKSLPTIYSPFKLEPLKQNRLLKITNEEIIFIYE